MGKLKEKAKKRNILCVRGPNNITKGPCKGPFTSSMSDRITSERREVSRVKKDWEVERKKIQRMIDYGKHPAGGDIDPTSEEAIRLRRGY